MEGFTGDLPTGFTIVNPGEGMVLFGIGRGGMTFDNFFEGYPGMVAFR